MAVIRPLNTSARGSGQGLGGGIGKECINGGLGNVSGHGQHLVFKTVKVAELTALHGITQGKCLLHKGGMGRYHEQTFQLRCHGGIPEAAALAMGALGQGMQGDVPFFQTLENIAARQDTVLEKYRLLYPVIHGPGNEFAQFGVAPGTGNDRTLSLGPR